MFLSFNQIKALRDTKEEYTKIVKILTTPIAQYEKIQITLLNHIIQKEQVDDKIIVEQLLLLQKITKQEIPQFFKDINKLRILLEKRIKISEKDYEIDEYAKQISFLYNAKIKLKTLITNNKNTLNEYKESYRFQRAYVAFERKLSFSQTIKQFLFFSVILGLIATLIVSAIISEYFFIVPFIWVFIVFSCLCDLPCLFVFLFKEPLLFIIIIPVVAAFILIPITIIEHFHDAKKLNDYYENYTITA